MCFQKGCEGYRKSIRRETLEGEFETFLKSLQPTEALFKVARLMFEELWGLRLELQKSRTHSLEAQLIQTDRQIEQLVDRIVDASSATVIGALEKRIQKLEREKVEIGEKIAACGSPLRSFDESVRTAMDFLASPGKLWNCGALEDKRALLKLAFVDRPSYVRNGGFRTAKTTLPFKVLGEFPAGLGNMARLEEETSNCLLETLQE
jgi:site-specific DNA recombinase